MTVSFAATRHNGRLTVEPAPRCGFCQVIGNQMGMVPTDYIYDVELTEPTSSLEQTLRNFRNQWSHDLRIFDLLDEYERLRLFPISRDLYMYPIRPFNTRARRILEETDFLGHGSFEQMCLANGVSLQEESALPIDATPTCRPYHPGSHDEL